jgi:hypothetical protein
LKTGDSGFEAESCNAQRGQRHLSRAHAAADKGRPGAPWVYNSQCPDKGTVCRTEIGRLAVAPEAGEVRLPERGQADRQLGGSWCQ